MACYLYKSVVDPRDQSGFPILPYEFRKFKRPTGTGPAATGASYNHYTRAPTLTLTALKYFVLTKETNSFSQFEIIVNVLVISFRFI